MQTTIPKDLDEALSLLHDLNDPAEIADWAAQSEADATNGLHFSTGMSLRNEWGLWQNSVLAQWFKSKGIHHADDMSSIVLTSFYRLMNGYDIDLDGQIKHYQDFWVEEGFAGGIPK